jgi:diaminohydroxyphosphoribosylaminopyrimidine deaminase / 5-amino-6-(5-phosphoribosylamino)uracil reductase
VVAIADCNPVHAGRGLELLRAKGVEVVCGVCAEEASELLAPFAKRITTGLPFVTLKLASTLDGRIADAQGGSRWITGAAARERVQAMRREADAIMVGAGTVRADNPSLLPRPDEGRKPLRVIVGSQIPKESTVLQDEAADRTLVRGGPLKDLFEELAALGVMHVLCEGGGQLAASLIEGGYVDRYQFFIAPKLMGSDGLPNLARVGGLVHEAIQLRFTKIEPLGEDLLVTAVHI